MNLRLFIASRPLCFFIVLALLVLVIPGLLIPLWKIKVQTIKNEVKDLLHSTQQEILYGIENTAKVLAPLSSSAKNLAKILSASFDGNELPFSKIETTVAPLMFQALSTIPHLSQISYIGMDGLFFSYYIKNNQQLFALYSNSSVPTMYTWYVQPVNRDTGELYGTAVKYHPSFIFNTSWFKNALNSTNGYASLGAAWTDDQDLMFLNSIGIKGKGAISLGFRATSLMSFFSSIDRINGSLYVATKDGKVIGKGNRNTSVILVRDDLVSVYIVNPHGYHKSLIGNVTCQQNGGSLQALKILGHKYMFYCAPLQIVGVESVYVLALLDNGLESLIHKDIEFAFIFLLIMCGAVFFAILCFMVLMCKAARKEICLRAALIKEMEAARELERKSMKKSTAFASASHDIRASLAGIKGLIEICRHQVRPKSELDSHLVHMESCANDLLDILNSILDSSKIEAGKMQLQIEEFDIAQVLESEVDLFYSAAMKKGVDVMLDMCDGSITKYSCVKGDRGKLKQILSNLLSNAVKFTSEGHVSVRAWAKEASSEYPVFSSTRNNSWLSCFLFKNDGASNDVESTNRTQKDPNCIEFIFEVNDTGKGIPKEKHKSVFENYVQVKETDIGHEGTGLGLGIVQSLVRLMGGEIGIVEKEVGEKGTCFRFNAFLVTCNNDETQGSGNNIVVREDDIESHGGYISSDSYQHSTPSIRLLSPWVEGSHVVLFIQNEERCKIARKFMESRGVKVSAMTNCEQLSATLRKIKAKILRRCSSSGRLEVVSRSNSSGRSKGVPLSSLDGTDEVPLPIQRRNNLRGVTNFILIVLDASGGPFRDLCRAVAEFRRDLRGDCSRVVWLDKPGANSIHVQGLDNHKLPPQDMLITKPFHGSRLNKVIGLLPEFGGVMPPKTYQNGNFATESSASTLKTQTSVSLRNSSSQNRRTKHGEIEEIGEPNSKRKMLLSGKKVLLVEDNKLLCKVARTQLSKLGATVDYCGNGEEALGLVLNGLSNQRVHRASYTIPYDYIFMDCQMPIMDGYEATRRIRSEEKSYGVCIPIIALTAHEAGEGTEMIMEAGMDFHLSKPLQEERLLEAITHINNKRRQQ